MNLKLVHHFLVFFTFLLCQDVLSQEIIQEQRSLTAILDDNGKGVAKATVKIDYLVRRKGDEVVFSFSYSDISIDATAGYYYKGKKYGSEVPGLKEKLQTIGGSYPTVSFDVYYGNIKQESFVASISTQNNLNMFSGEFKTFTTTTDRLDKPQWRLEITGFSTFSYHPDPVVWMGLDGIVEKYEREIKERTEYEELINDADRLYNSNQLKEAELVYIKAGKHPLSDDHPSRQLEKLRMQLAKNEKESLYNGYIKNAEEAENSNDHSSALAYYKAAFQTGFDNFHAEIGIKRAQRSLDDIKAKQEEEIKNKEKKEKKLQEDLLAQREKDAEKVDKLLNEKDDELQKRNDNELKRLKEGLDKEERKALEEAAKERLKEQQKERERIIEAEKQRVKKEQLDRRDQDKKYIERYEDDMSYDPVLYAQYVAEADEYFEKGMAINPYKKMELDKKWWDLNPYMESFRDDMNEPRRQEAWQNSLNDLYEIQANFDMAKDGYIKAIKYTDKNSKQYKYLLKQVEFMNMMLDLQHEFIDNSYKNEQQRQENYEKTKQYKVAAQLSNNKYKAMALFSASTHGAVYAHWNSDDKVNKAVQQQIDFERRLNEADQQLKQDQLVTGVTTQIVANAVLDDSKVAKTYDNHSAGINVYTLSGFAGYPIVANTEPVSGYLSETETETMNVMPFQAGIDLWPHRGKTWDLGINGDLLFGVLPIKGYKNLFFSYGGSIKFNVGIKRIKFAIEAGYQHRSGTFEYDQDVALADLGNPYQQPTNRILIGEFNYSVLKAGAGLHINLANQYGDSHIRLLLFAEKPSFYNDYNIKKPVLSFAGQFMANGGLTIGFDYSKNYPVAGTAENLFREFTDRDKFIFYFGKTWTIAKTK